MADGSTHVFLTPVAVDRADDFDRFLREVVHPAVDARQPHLSGRWRALRPSVPDGDVLTYVFLFDGGDLDTDWDLGKLLEDHLGEDQAAHFLQQLDDLTVPVRRWAEGLDDEPDRRQIGWTCSPVRRSST